MQRIVYTKEDGTLAIVVPAPGANIAEVATRDVPVGKSFEIVATADIPTSRLFRAAWKLESGWVTVDLDKAVEISHDIRRAKRAEEFAPLDAEIALAIPGTDLVALEAERQAVRDKYAELQVAIDSAESVDDLTALVGD